MAMTREQQIALAAIGGLLLLPGLCGAYFGGSVILDHLSRRQMRMIDLEPIVWLIAQPSMMIGCLGLFLIAWGTRSPRLATTAYVIGWIALATTVLLGAFIIYASDFLSTRGANVYGASVVVCFAGSFLIFVLPGLLAYRRAQKDRNGA